MGSLFVDAPSGPYTNVYDRSDEFPQEALNRIPKGLLNSIDSGNAEFFMNLAKSFPDTYAAFVNRCPPVKLLELVVERVTLTGIEKRDHIYCWGCLVAGRLVQINIPHFEPEDSIRKNLQAKYLSALPQPFAAFYQYMDGMTITTSMSMSGFDLPNSFSDWDFLKVYYETRDLDPGDGIRLANHLGGGDLRVFFTARNGNFIVVKLGDTSRKLYLVHRENPASAFILNDSIHKLDKYFATAIISEEDVIPFLI